jgi:hypothetical protein
MMIATTQNVIRTAHSNEEIFPAAGPAGFSVDRGVWQPANARRRAVQNARAQYFTTCLIARAS